MKSEYREYLQSAPWKEKAKRIKDGKKYTCELCGNHILLEVVAILTNSDHPSWSIYEIHRFAESISERMGDRNKLIEVHHKTYKNLQNEKDGELACLCRPCHVFCGENAVGNSAEEAWRKSQEQVQALLANINNQPDGIKEFRHLPEITVHLSLHRHGYENEKLKLYFLEHANEYTELMNDKFELMDAKFSALIEDYLNEQNEISLPDETDLER